MTKIENSTKALIQKKTQKPQDSYILNFPNQKNRMNPIFYLFIQSTQKKKNPRMTKIENSTKALIQNKTQKPQDSYILNFPNQKENHKPQKRKIKPGQ